MPRKKTSKQNPNQMMESDLNPHQWTLNDDNDPNADFCHFEAPEISTPSFLDSPISTAEMDQLDWLI
jgi:hypothetical protein